MKPKLVALALLAGTFACAQQEEAKPESGQAQSSARTPREALELGLAWLRGRARDGIWFVNYGDQSVPSPAYTAFALAPIAKALPRQERRQDALVAAATQFLLKAQREDGGIDTGGLSTYDNYYTSAALMALSIVDDPAHAPAREKMKQFLLSLQRREQGRTQGGFGYNKRRGADLSNAQFAVESLRTAGIPADHPAMKRALAFLERAQNRSENASNKDAVYEFEGKEGKRKVVPGNDGSAGYEPGVSKAGLRRLPDGTYVPRGYGSMTYALLKCYLLVGLTGGDERVQAAVDWLGRNYGWDENPGFRDIAKERNQPEAPYWGLYYYYMTAAKALKLLRVDRIDTPQGPRDWRKDLAHAIVRRQRPDGSWINDRSKRWEEADPQLATCYAVIALQEILDPE